MAGYAFAVLFLYFLPPIVAGARRHRSVFAILALTLLLGWTGIGWIVAIIWSLTGNVKTDSPAIHAHVVVNASSHIGAPSPDAMSAERREILEGQLAGLRRQAQGWDGEIDAVAARRAPGARRKIEVIGDRAKTARRVVAAIGEEAREGLPAQGGAPAARAADAAHPPRERGRARLLSQRSSAGARRLSQNRRARLLRAGGRGRPASSDRTRPDRGRPARRAGLFPHERARLRRARQPARSERDRRRNRRLAGRLHPARGGLGVRRGARGDRRAPAPSPAAR